MATPRRRSAAKRAAPAKKRSAKKAPARKRTPKKGAPKRAAVKRAAARRGTAKKAAGKKRARTPKVDYLVLEYPGMSGSTWKCKLDAGVVKGVARSIEEARAMAKPTEQPTEVKIRPNGVGKPQLWNSMGKRVKRAEEQPECCYYINGEWVCW